MKLTMGRMADLRGYLEVVGVIAAVALAGWFVPLEYRALSQVYLLAVLVLSLRVSRGPLFAAAILSAAAWDFFAIPPRLTWSIDDVGDAAMLLTYILVALVAGQLSARLRAQGRTLGAAMERERALTESDRLHRALFDSVSHELRTPLTVVRSAVWALQKKSTAETVALVDEIRQATDRLDRLVGNLLDQTRLESGTLAPMLDWCDVRDLIQEARHETGPALDGRILTIEIAEDTPLWRVDEALTERAIANLLLNAATHTPAGTPIAIRTGVEGDRVFLSVVDQGPGIPAAMRSRLFAKLQRGAAAGVGGLGLGLSIVKGFVDAQGGDVVYADEPGGGAKFTLYLPGSGPVSSGPV